MRWPSLSSQYLNCSTNCKLFASLTGKRSWIVRCAVNFHALSFVLVHKGPLLLKVEESLTKLLVIVRTTCSFLIAVQLWTDWTFWRVTEQISLTRTIFSYVWRTKPTTKFVFFFRIKKDETKENDGTMLGFERIDDCNDSLEEKCSNPRSMEMSLVLPPERREKYLITPYLIK